MKTVAIVGNGPVNLLPDLFLFQDEINYWIGADKGAYHLAVKGIQVEYALGDFDSLTEEEKQFTFMHSNNNKEFLAEKDETDIELALNKAFELNPDRIFLFGVTGGRLDHELINIQLLYAIKDRGIRGIIVDQSNQIEMLFPGEYQITENRFYPYISFIPYTQHVKGICLTGFYYPLTNKNITWGSTLCISNRLLSKSGTFSFEKGIVLLVKSCDTIQT